MYVLVRTDLSPSQQIVQSCHAVIEASGTISPNLDHPHLVLCGVKSEEQLAHSLQSLREKGIVCKPFYEADLGGQLTAFATEPIFDDQRQFFRKFQLLKAKPCFEEAA